MNQTALIREYQGGNVDAGQKIINDNMGWIGTVARSYVGPLEYQESISIATVGMYHALDTYTFKFAFTSYSKFIMRKQLHNYLIDNSIVRVPGCKNPFEVVNFDETYLGSYETEYQDPCIREKIDRHLKRLPEREQAILRMRYGLGCPESSLKEIADRFGLCRERIRQLLQNALACMRQDPDLKKMYLELE